jgi:hypothetical protein
MTDSPKLFSLSRLFFAVFLTAMIFLIKKDLGPVDAFLEVANGLWGRIAFTVTIVTMLIGGIFIVVGNSTRFGLLIASGGIVAFGSLKILTVLIEYMKVI